MKSNRLNLLLVEDDEIDRRAIRRAFAERGIEVALVEVHDGQEALDLLKHSPERLPPRPFTILLDLNMPTLDGIGFLQRLRDPASGLEDKNAAVVVLSTSASERDIELANRHSIAGYVVKSDYDASMSYLVSLLTTCQNSKAVQVTHA